MLGWGAESCKADAPADLLTANRLFHILLMYVRQHRCIRLRSKTSAWTIELGRESVICSCFANIVCFSTRVFPCTKPFPSPNESVCTGPTSISSLSSRTGKTTSSGRNLHVRPIQQPSTTITWRRRTRKSVEIISHVGNMWMSCVRDVLRR
jgi:hypothetical protein